jgi:hypothetical protein
VPFHKRLGVGVRVAWDIAQMIGPGEALLGKIIRLASFNRNR